MGERGKRLAEPKVLVLDDEENIVKVVTRILQATGYEVHGASDLDEAKQVLQARGPFDVALLDYSLEGTTCGEAFEVLRATQRELKVVLMSGFPLSELKADFPQAEQCAAFLKKPFGLDGLVKLMASICQPGAAASSAPSAGAAHSPPVRPG